MLKRKLGISTASLDLILGFQQVFLRDRLLKVYLQDHSCFGSEKNAVGQNVLRLNLDDMINRLIGRRPFASIVRRAPKARLLESSYHSSIIAVRTYDIIWTPGVGGAYHAKQRLLLVVTVNRPSSIELLMATVFRIDLEGKEKV